MKLNKLKGLGVAMITPFQTNGAIDIPALKKLTAFLIDGGVDYLVVQGTTGESPVLSTIEKQLTLDTVAEINKGRLPIVFGIGGNNTLAVADDFNKFDLTEVDAILSVSPYYNKPTQEGIFQHYKTIADATELPIIVYNVPGRTASNILPETTLRLAKSIPNIVGIKEASRDMEQIMEVIRTKPSNFIVISGDDALTMPIIAAGADGVISVAGNGFPKQFKAMVQAGMNDDMVTARNLHYQILPIISHLFAEGNPGGIKEVLAFKGLTTNKMRLPLVNISVNRRQIIQDLSAEINKL